MPGDDATVARFIEAQEQREAGFATALAELRAGRKRGHWIWWIFPQLAGLGRSWESRHYAIADPQEARAYLHDAQLRGRLLAASLAVGEQLADGRTLVEVMGSSIDATMLVSSLTLFSHVARQLSAEPDLDGREQLVDTAEAILDAAAAQGYPRCAFTLAALRSDV